MKPLLLVLIPVSKVHLDQIGAHFELLYAPTQQERNARITSHGPDIRAVLTIGTVGLTAAEMASMPKLALVCTLGVGYEMVDVAHARAQGIALANGAGTNDDSVADHAFGLLLATVRQIPASDSACRQGVWRDALPMLPQLAHKRIGIMGLGAIGSKVAQRARGFDMLVGYHNRKPRADVPYAYFDSMPALAAWCDCLVICAPGGPETRHRVDAEVLAALGPAGYLVNVARGSIVDTAALASALEAKAIAGAGLDVYESEPQPPATLMAFPQVVLTPHVGGRSPEAIQQSVDRFIANAGAHFAGRPMVSPI